MLKSYLNFEYEKISYGYGQLLPQKSKRSWKRIRDGKCPFICGTLRGILSLLCCVAILITNWQRNPTSDSLVHNNSLTPSTPCCSNKIILSGIVGHDIFRQRFVETMKTPAADFVTSPQHAATWQQRKQKTVNKYDSKQPRLWLTPRDVYYLHSTSFVFLH